MPPHPTIGILPSVHRYIAARHVVDGANSGLPDNPPGALRSGLFSVAGRATVMMDSGIRSGADVARALALGAQTTFAGKAFLWGLGALGRRGPSHVIDLLTEETQAALGQIGARNPAEARNIVVRHPGVLRF